MAKSGPGNAAGEALRKALNGRKLTWLADETGIKRERLNRLALGRSEIKLTEAAAIAAALSVPVETFLPPVEEAAAVVEEESNPVPFVSVPPHVLETKAATVSAS